MEQQLILDRYRPLEHLGEGGFGTVVLAWDTRMQRRVAIKRLPFPLDSAGKPHRPPGLGEARTAAMLNHPAIVTVFDFDTDADEAFLVMEYVDGASVADLLDDVGGPLTIEETAAVVEAVADALSFAHENGVLHLDVKPENVLVDREGRVKVADFGIAELSSAGGHGTAWGGTVGYMPLEQLQGQRVTEQTDGWAFAVLAYECLTGDNPFDAETPQSAIVQLEVVEPPAPSEYEPDLPEAIDDVLFAALARHPQDRYPSVAQFANALEPHLGDPQAGRASLAELVSAYAAEDAEAGEPGLDDVGLWDRLRGPLGLALVRAAAVAESGWLAWSGLAHIGLDRVAMFGAIGLVALAGALAPALGVLLGVGCLLAGVFSAGAAVTAAALALVVAVWWWGVARRSAGAAVLPLAAPLLGAARLGPAQPLLAGFALEPLPAALTGLLGGVLAMLASAVSAQGAPYLWVWLPDAAVIGRYGLAFASVRALATSPAAYVALAGWPIAAAIMSLACSRATRFSAMVGAVAGSAALGGCYLGALEVSSAMGRTQAWAGTQVGVSVGASLILVLAVAALGAPLRTENDDHAYDDTTDD